jgi:hypothetical protein
VQVKAAEDVSNARFTKPEELMEEMLAQHDDIHDGDEDQFEVSAQLLDPKKMVDFECFKRLLWGSIGERGVDSLQVWTQIRSFIKGSYEAAQKRRPLTKDEYLSIVPKRCRLCEESRRAAFTIFERYQEWLDKEGRWDDMDRTMELIQLIQHGKAGGLETRYDKIYVDEVQVLICTLAISPALQICCC